MKNLVKTVSASHRLKLSLPVFPECCFKFLSNFGLVFFFIKERVQELKVDFENIYSKFFFSGEKWGDYWGEVLT